MARHKKKVEAETAAPEQEQEQDTALGGEQNARYIAELKAIEARDGVLKPEAVVEFARDPETELHKLFDWDDSAAATKWRLHQARRLIKVRITYVGRKPYRAFVSLTPQRKIPGGGYQSTVVVMSDAELRRQLLIDALAELGSFRQKYARLQELSIVFAAIDRILGEQKAA